MKKFITVISAIFMSAAVFSAGYETDVSIYNELSASYNSGFYPGAVQLAERLSSEFPESAYIGSALVMKGESLVHMNLFAQAGDVLQNAMESNLEPSLKNTCNYWMAKVYESRKDYDSALSSYYDYCSYTKESGQYYPQAILGAARIYYKKNEYKKAIPLFEYAVTHGTNYNSNDYIESLLKLVDSYNNSGKAKKSLALYQKFTPELLGSTNWYLLTEYAGDAHNNLKEYKKAYDLYCEVLASGEKTLAATALKKAYNVSAQHKKEVGSDPGSVLAEAQKTLSDSPSLLAEFWTRLGTDAYYEGDYAKAVNYFDEAEKHSTPELSEYVAMYRSEMIAGKNVTKESARRAEDSLLAAQLIQKANEHPVYVSDYYRLLAKYAAYQENWEDVKRYGSQVQPADEISDYYMAIAHYKTNDYTKVNSLLESGDSQLYALSLARLQRMKEAAYIFDKSEKNGTLSESARLDYAKVLILSGRYTESQIQCARSSLPEAKYILGLAQFNTRSWPYAEESFTSYLKNVDRNDKEQQKSVSYATFYLGYSQYRQGKYKEAYKNLSSFAETYSKHELLWNAQMAASKTAVQLGKYDDAIRMAEAAIRTSGTNAQNLEESVLLCADIHCDEKNYSSAINLLTPYSKLNNTFGMKSLFKMAQIFETLNQTDTSDATYKAVYDGFGGEKLAEEALFRRGELFYAKKDYKISLLRFKEYTTKYPTGQFIPASMYYTADCYDHTNNEKFAIMQNTSLIQRYPDSTYVYSATKNLISLQRRVGNYGEALKYARLLIEKYGDQARNDNMAEVANDLEKLANGKNEPIVAKESEYKKEGGLNTPLGRKAGTELVQLYAKSTSTSADAVKLAEQLLPAQEKNLAEESFYAAQNADILAQSYRQKNENGLSARYYLKAAQYYRRNKNTDELVSCALYGAYEAFTAEGLVGDANECAKNLKELYPDTSYARSAKIR